MTEDYFDDAEDADFLALAQQIDPGRSIGGNGPSIQGAATSAERPAPQRTPAATSSANTGAQRPETPKTNQTAPKVLRPGFNAIIVNTRQVILPTCEMADNTERYR